MSYPGDRARADPASAGEPFYSIKLAQPIVQCRSAPSARAEQTSRRSTAANGPVLHLQGLKRAQAEALEEGLAEALRAEGLLVKGGH